MRSFSACIVAVTLLAASVLATILVGTAATAQGSTVHAVATLYREHASDLRALLASVGVQRAEAAVVSSENAQTNL